MTKPRGGSRKRTVYEHFLAHGVDDAQLLGSSLGLRASTVKSWLSKWEKTPEQSSLSRRRVEIYGDEHDGCAWIGTVIQQGPQQSEIRFLEGPPELVGKTLFILNRDFSEV